MFITQQRRHTLPEDSRVLVNIRYRCGRSDERHVMKGRQQNAAIEGKEVHIAVEVGVIGGSGFATVAGRRRPEAIFGAAAQLGHMPGQLEFADHFLNAGRPAGRQGNRLVKGRLGKHRGQRGAYSGQRKGISGQGAADPARIDIVGFGTLKHALGHGRGDPKGGGRHAAANRFADGEHIGLESIGRRIAVRPTAHGVGFVNDQQRARAAGQLAQGGVEPRVRQHNTDVGHSRLGQHTGHIAGRQGCFQAGAVVKFHYFGRHRGIDRRADIAGARAGHTVIQRNEGLIYRAMIAPVKDQNFGPLGNLAGNANGKAIGIGGSQRKLPVGQPKTALQLLAHPDGTAVGSMAVIPCWACCANACAVAVGEWPGMAPVSPRQKSI